MISGVDVSGQKSWLDAWHVSPSASREYDFIDGLRGIAILMVLCCHHFYINPNAGPTTQFFGALVAAGGAGVKLFFVLSGFLISYPFWKQRRLQATGAIPRGYARRRFWKIYPPLALSLLILTPLYIAQSGDWSYASIAAEWLTGLAFLIPVNGKLNPVMWTLVVEVQFYILLPFVFLALKSASSRAALWILTLVFLVVPVTYQVTTGLSPSFAPNIDSHFPAALSFFYLGILVAYLDREDKLVRRSAQFGMVGIVLWPVSLLIMAWAQTHPGPSSSSLLAAMSWVQLSASGCLLLFIADSAHPVAKALCNPALRWCGIISYEWYLFHQPIALWARYYLGPAEGSILKYFAIVGGSLLVSTAVAAFIYLKFSLPLLKYGRGSK